MAKWIMWKQPPIGQPKPTADVLVQVVVDGPVVQPKPEVGRWKST